MHPEHDRPLPSTPGGELGDNTGLDEADGTPARPLPETPRALSPHRRPSTIDSPKLSHETFTGDLVNGIKALRTDVISSLRRASTATLARPPSVHTDRPPSMRSISELNHHQTERKALFGAFTIALKALIDTHAGRTASIEDGNVELERFCAILELVFRYGFKSILMGAIC
jgi:hypothetical protein